MMFGNKAPCRACDQKSDHISQLLSERGKECQTCSHYKANNGYLKGLIDQLHKDWANERAEFKRTVDRLIAFKGSPPVGQGTIDQGKMVSVDEMMGIFDEVEDKK